jgi:hypothetical protein
MVDPIMKVTSSRATNRFLQLGLLFVTASLFGARASAQSTCPWINNATASGLLGGETQPSITLDSTGRAGACSFTFQRHQKLLVLNVAVQVNAEPPVHLASSAMGCTSETSTVAAIGNEALACRSDRDGRFGERIIGRVRDSVFTITLSSTGERNVRLDRARMKSSLLTAAEQVAGNLF